MARLRQCGGFFSLLSKGNSRRPMWSIDSSSVTDADTVDAYMANARYIRRQCVEFTMENREKCFGLEFCNCFIDFLILTRDEFSKDNAKERLFGKQFLNIDCPSVIRTCFRCITLGQTFNDDFTMDLRAENNRGQEETILRSTMSSCLLTKVRLLIMCFIHRFVLEHYLLRSISGNVQEFIGNRVFFHDRLVQLFMVECESPNSPVNRDDVYVVFDVRKTGSRRDVCVFVLLGEYLREGFCEDLSKIEEVNALPTTFAMTKRTTTPLLEYALDESCTHSREVVVNRVRIERGMAREVERCCENRFRFFNTVGGLLLNRQMDERQYLLPWNKFTEVFDVFCFLLAMYCQVFDEREGGVFFVEWTEKFELDEEDENVARYYVKDFVCSDGEIRRCIKYECDASDDMLRECAYVRKVYRSAITDMGYVQLGYNSRGHLPRGSPKKYFKKHVYYGKEYDMQKYEDRGFKHLYEGHHKCTKKRYCDEFCKAGLQGSHHKRRDYFQLENEEMSCRDARVSYEGLNSFFCERKELDKVQKSESYNTMIPPYANEDCTYKRTVYVTELEKDLSIAFFCPSQALDPCWVDYDEGALMERVKSVGVLSWNDDKDELMESVDAVRRNGGGPDRIRGDSGYLHHLNGYIKNFARNEQPDMTILKMMLRRESKEYVGNLLLTASIEILRKAMWILEERLKTNDRMMAYEGMRPLFSPSCVHLLSSLNVLRRGCSFTTRLSDDTLMTERSGSLLGSVLKERSVLLEECYATCRRMRMRSNEPGMVDASKVGRGVSTMSSKNVEHKGDVNDFETRAYTYQILIDVYKYLSIDVHHWRGQYCPTCHPTHLIKQELQTMVESVREALPLGREGVTLSSSDPVNIEPIERSSRITFVEREKRVDEIDLVDEFMKHSEVGKMLNDCDLVANAYRTPRPKREVTQCSDASNEINNLLTRSMNDFVNLNDEGGHLVMREVRRQLDKELLQDKEDSIEAQAQEDSFFRSEIGYYPYKLSFWTDSECCKIASTFTSMRDDVRYQGCDVAGTYGRKKNSMIGGLSSSKQRSTQRIERMNRYHPIPQDAVRRRIVRPVRRRLFNDVVDDDNTEDVVWREQRDSIRVDFACAMRDEGVKYDESWLNVFGKYWIGLEDWCKSDVDQMHWLMMGANHMTVDTCGENMGAYIIGSRNIDDARCPSLHTPSRVLRRELGMQLPIRSRCKVRRDVLKFAMRNNIRNSEERSLFDETYWKTNGYIDEGKLNADCCEILLPNSKDCFFDECIVQPFHSFTVYPTRLFGFGHDFNDVYEVAHDTYQQLQMDVSNELRTFAVGAPRFSSNGTFTNFDRGESVMRDCRHVTLSPLFRYHYELPTNPNAEWIDRDVVNQLVDIWRPNRKLDVFQDPNEYGYVASQLTHLPRMLGYEFGNILSYDRDGCRLEDASEATYVRSLMQEVYVPFNERSDTVALQQREILRDDSMYVVNRRSLIANKCQVFYNDDSSSMFSPALATNALKWSESVLGDCSQIFSTGHLSEPTRTIALKMDKPKLCIYRGKKKRNPRFYDNFPRRSSVTGDEIWGCTLTGLEKFCIDNLSVTKFPRPIVCESQDYLQESLFTRYKARLLPWDDVLQRLWKTPGTGQLTTSANRRMWMRGIVGRGCYRQLEPFERQSEDQTLRTYNAYLYGTLTASSGEVVRASLRGQPVVEIKMINGVTFPVCDGGSVLYGKTRYDDCPNVVMRDVNRLWSTLGDALPGVSLTIPAYSDGGVDYVPGKNCPAYALSLPYSLNATIPVNDQQRHCSTGFQYDASVFCELGRDYDQDGQISTDKTCYEHLASRRSAYGFQRRRFEPNVIVPRSDPLKPMCPQDDLLSKVPRSNIALRSKLKSCNSLRCLTMFEDESNKGGREEEEGTHYGVVKALAGYGKILRDNYFGCRRLDGYIRACESRNRRQLGNSSGTRLCNQLRNTLFHLEFAFVKGVCMVYDGLNCPGRSKKSSSLLREFSTFTRNHYLVGRGLIPKSKEDRALSYGESKKLMRCIEHDRMLYSNYGRQFSAFCLDDDRREDFECQGGGLIDETVFVRQPRHEQSDLSDWKLSVDKDNLVSGGVRSSCYNACSFDRDYIGKMVHSYQAVFSSERESEMFYVEVMLRRLTSGRRHIDCFKRARITRFVSVCRERLEDFGRDRDHPRSAVSVDEDFHYMRGKCGANDNKESARYQAWPTNSIFLYRSDSTIPLNDTLSLTMVSKSKKDTKCVVSAVRGLKRILFRDGFESRTKINEAYATRNDSNDFCCECTYGSCTHHEDVTNEMTKAYLKLTCAYCAIRIERPCDDTIRCCIRKMEDGEWCTTVTDAWTFAKTCRHFNFEKTFIDFVLEGNPFENLHRHTERYFEYIDKRQDLTTQCLKLAGRMVKEGGFEDGIMSNVCKYSDNGTRCWACERQPKDSVGVRYIEIRPRVNEDHARKQIAKRVNVCAINNLRYRKVCLEKVGTQWEFRQQLRGQAGMCTINCNQRHNLHSSMATLPLRFRTKFNDIAHWPRQNYEIDHVSGVSGDKCGCGREWNDSGTVHYLWGSCVWMPRTGDVISMTYDRDIHEGMNPITSYGEFAVHHACRCLPSVTLLRHCPSTLRLRKGGGSNDYYKDCCNWKSVSCGENCSSCVHYCSSNFTC